VAGGAGDLFRRGSVGGAAGGFVAAGGGVEGVCGGGSRRVCGEGCGVGE